jgi:hypothetical protein
MMNTYKDEWIFFLKLQPKLPEYYFQMDQHFKAYGYNLIPVNLSDFLELTKKDDGVNVVCVIHNYTELSYYLRKAKKLLLMLLRMNKIQLITASSYEITNENSNIRVRDSYDFYSLPLKRSYLCDKILEKVIGKSLDTDKWPGGKRPRMSISG